MGGSNFQNGPPVPAETLQAIVKQVFELEHDLIIKEVPNGGANGEQEEGEADEAEPGAEVEEDASGNAGKADSAEDADAEMEPAKEEKEEDLSACPWRKPGAAK